ncbi:hypothetical protein [Streptomyces dubilierae]|uniref:Uncharacterized protein n=1 Tax=Streptomyces dubilierae TaxID=3075533 RepID=A0ABU2P8G8_9ACTN|nr:hypothetical protein [Streptomyces sp. DSM 41921]MDT0388083.1 hypothetical protein [Streptomyces sp. DSM 41921]
MAQSDRARRWARWLAAHRVWQHGLRWLLMALVGMPLFVVAAESGLPEWTPGIVVVLLLAMDDGMAWYVKRWSAAPHRPGGERSSG